MNDTSDELPSDDSIRRVVGLVLRAAERGETEALLSSVQDPASRLFLEELARYARQDRLIMPARPESCELDAMHPTSAELLIEEELERTTPLADPVETELLVWLAQARNDGARLVWERTLHLLADDVLPA